MDLWKVFCFLLISLTTSLWESQAFAWDPTTVATSAQAISGILGGLDKADEVADVGFSLQDLLSELGSEPSGEAEINHTVKKLEDLNSKARDLRWSQQEIRAALEMDLKSGNSLRSSIKSLKHMISASKRIAEITGLRPKAGERAAQIQSIRINSMILEELQSLRRAQMLAYLDQREVKARRDLLMSEINESRKNKGQKP